MIAIAKDRLVLWSLGERRLSYLYYQVFNSVALRHVLERSCIMPISGSDNVQPRSYWTKPCCHCHPLPGRALVVGGPRSCYRVRTLTHQKQDGKEIGLWHQQCSASVLGKCRPDVLPCLRQILLLFTFTPSSNMQLSGMSVTRKQAGITWLLNAWNDVNISLWTRFWRKTFSNWVGFLLTIILQGKVLTPL